MQTTYALLEPFSYNRGYRTVVPVDEPAEGSTYTYTVPSFAWQRLIACQFTLTTSSTPGNRFVTIDYSGDAGITFLSDGVAALQAESLAVTYNGSNTRGSETSGSGLPAFFPLWGGFMESGWQFTLNVDSIDTGDQLSGIVLLLETFEVGEQGYIVGGTTTSRWREWIAEHFGN